MRYLIHALMKERLGVMATGLSGEYSWAVECDLQCTYHSILFYPGTWVRYLAS